MRRFGCVAVVVAFALLLVAAGAQARTAYVTNKNSSTVTPIDVASGRPGTPIPVGTDPVGVAFTPDGQTAYVTGETSNTVTPIDVASGRPGTPIRVGGEPFGVAFTPDGRTAYVTNPSLGTVTPIDVASGRPGTPITVGAEPVGVAFTPDGKTAYVAKRGSSTVTPIDVATGRPGTPIRVGDAPFGVAFVPNQAPAARFSAAVGRAGSATRFDGSGSSDRDGSVARYGWDFGDGTTTTTTPTVSHAYASAGSYTATLTVTDNEGCSTRLVFTGQTASCSGSSAARIARIVSVAAAPLVAAAPRPAECVVSSLHRKTLAQAETLLRRHHCGLGKVTRPRRHHRGRLVVSRQSLRSGSHHRGGTRIAIRLTYLTHRTPKPRSGR